MATVRIERLGPGDEAAVHAAGGLFDRPPAAAWTTEFLEAPGHHLLLGFLDDDRSSPAVGFVTGVEMVHPDKGRELLVYELGTDEAHRHQGVATALLAELAAVAADRSCTGLWVATEPDNEAALATYRAAGFGVGEPSVVLARLLDAPADR